MNKNVNKFNKIFTTTIDPGITLTSNEIKNFIKVNKRLQNREISLKRATEIKIKSQDGGFLGNVLGPLMKVGL